MLTEDDKNAVGMAVARVITGVLESHLRNAHGMSENEINNTLRLLTIDLIESLKKEMLKEREQYGKGR